MKITTYIQLWENLLWRLAIHFSSVFVSLTTCNSLLSCSPSDVLRLTFLAVPYIFYLILFCKVISRHNVFQTRVSSLTNTTDMKLWYKIQQNTIIILNTIFKHNSWSVMFSRSVLQKPNVQCGWQVRKQHVSTFRSYFMTTCLDQLHFHILTSLILTWVTSLMLPNQSVKYV